MIWWGLIKIRQRPTLPHSFPCSTIGAIGLNFRVRDGIGYTPSAITTEKKKKQIEILYYILEYNKQPNNIDLQFTGC